MDRKLVTINIHFYIFSCSIYTSRNGEIEIKSLNTVAREQKKFMSTDGSKTSNASSSTPIDRKVGSSTLFGSKDVYLLKNWNLSWMILTVKRIK